MEVENIYLKSIHFCIVPGLDKFQKYIIHSDKIEGKQSLYVKLSTLYFYYN